MTNKTIYSILRAVIIILLTPVLNALLTEIIGKENSFGIIGFFYLCVFLYLVGEFFLKIKEKSEENNK
jgi:hypothetical protein